MELWKGGFLSVMNSIIQILVLIIGIVLPAWEIMGLLEAFDICFVGNK